jgi:hypothetical protein
VFIDWIVHGYLATIPFVVPVVAIAIAKLETTTRANISISNSSTS